jgi:hypothetical protein
VFGAGRGPQAECAVYMRPRVVRASNRHKLRDAVASLDRMLELGRPQYVRLT